MLPVAVAVLVQAAVIVAAAIAAELQHFVQFGRFSSTDIAALTAVLVFFGTVKLVAVAPYVKFRRRTFQH
jgi:hypothetical protein